MTSYFIERKEEILPRISSVQKYQKLSKYSREALKENYLWFSNLSSFNDPFEGMVKYAPLSNAELIFSNELMHPWNLPGKDEIQLRELLYKDERAFFLRYEKIYRDWYEELLRKSRIKGYHCLFTTLKNGENKTAEEDILMWAHYTDGMKGFRINYDPEVLFEGFPEGMDVYFISYIENPVTVDLAQEFYNLQRSPSAGRYTSVHEETLFQTKSIHWKYEAELRLRLERSGKWVSPSGCIKSIDFGYRMSDREITAVQRLVKYHHPSVRFYRALPSKNEFRIELVPCPDVTQNTI